MEKIILPFDDDQLWDIISNQESPNKQYCIDYENSYSNLGDSLLYYCSNLDLDCYFDVEGCSTEFKFSLIDQYLNIRKLCTNKQLAAAIASIFLRAKNIAYIQQSILTNDEVDQYINTHVDQIDRSITFLDSLLVYMIFQNKSLHNLIDYSKLPQNNDKQIPINLINVCAIPEFACFYSVIDYNRLMWFEYQFKNPIYDNKDLSAYIFNEDNIIAAWLYNQGENSVSHF